MIFAAGLGTRLKPLTDHTPKALVCVAGRPMLEHVILKLKAEGFTEIVVNIHHFGQQIIDFLGLAARYGTAFGQILEQLADLLFIVVYKFIERPVTGIFRRQRMRIHPSACGISVKILTRVDTQIHIGDVERRPGIFGLST